MERPIKSDYVKNKFLTKESRYKTYANDLDKYCDELEKDYKKLEISNELASGIAINLTEISKRQDRLLHKLSKQVANYSGKCPYEEKGYESYPNCNEICEEDEKKYCWSCWLEWAMEDE